MNSLSSKTLWILFFLVLTIQNPVLANKRTAMVFVDHLKRQSIETQASYYGRLKPLKLFKVYSPLEALIIKVKVQEGRKVCSPCGQAVRPRLEQERKGYEDHG